MHIIDIYKSIASNNSFLKVLFTEKNLQVAESTIAPGEGSGLEQWEGDMVLLVLFGSGEITLGADIHPLAPGTLLCINQGSEYIIENTNNTELKMLLVFGPIVLKSDMSAGSKIAEIMDPYRVRQPKGL